MQELLHKTVIQNYLQFYTLPFKIPSSHTKYAYHNIIGCTPLNKMAIDEELCYMHLVENRKQKWSVY